jgi:hypothetical protein
LATSEDVDAFGKVSGRTFEMVSAARRMAPPPDAPVPQPDRRGEAEPAEAGMTLSATLVWILLFAFFACLAMVVVAR